MSRIVGLAALTGGLGVSAAPPGDAPTSPPQDPAAVEFFEKRVRPILVERCLACHGPTKQKGELRLDSRAGVLAGGSSGPAVEPGKAEASLLVSAINYGELYHMPPKSKLPPEEIEALTKWVAQGAPWGIEAPKGEAEAKAGGSGDGFEGSAEFARRAQFWSFQPIRRPAVPAVSEGRARWPRNSIDRFLLAAMEERGLAPAGEADRRTLIRRLTYDLLGLPPAVEEVAAFVADDAPDAYEKLVDRLLASPHYGERWGRHWLDLARYAETAGHEFDYDVLNAYRYRDYVVRAFNLDLPYDQFVIEQMAGDLLSKPRRHPTEGFNESILGTGFYFLGEGTHSPVDVREEGVRRIDNQIDVFSKTFLGLTVSCARCHDHKFDPISARDYYALAGFLRSSRHQQAFIDSDVHITPIVDELEALKRTILDLLNQASSKLPQGRRAAIEAARSSRPSPGARIHEATAEGFRVTKFDDWKATGDAFGGLGSACGDFRLELGDARRLVPIRAGELHSGRVSDQLQGVVRSPTFTIQQRYLHLLASGTSGRINVVVDGFEKNRDPIYGGLTIAIAAPGEPQWITRDLEMWKGHRAYIEVCDGSAADYTGARTRRVDGRGSLRVAEVSATDRPEPPHAPPAPAGPVVDLKALVTELATVDSPLADRLDGLLNTYRELEAKLPEPSLAPAIVDGDGEDENLMIRGNPKTLGEAVPRRLLSILGGRSQASASGGSGRLELAQSLVDVRSNPLLPRVLVNRLWKQHFGEGIVKSTDDFGAMGQPPSHPALLDWLASEFVDRGWSLKALHRLMVGSSAYRMQSRSNEKADELDPNNVLLHRMNVRRLEAESIRDALLAVSGRLDRTVGGPSVAPHLSAFMDGRGRPDASGPLDGDGRRSLYVQVRRNFLTPMFLAFDAPVPFSTMGRRNVSNVPAQALTLLNDPLVVELAEAWAGRLLAEGDLPVDRRIERLYETAFGRPPTDHEVRRCATFVAERKDSDPSRTWTDLCHVLFNVKEFIYVD